MGSVSVLFLLVVIVGDGEVILTFRMDITGHFCIIIVLLILVRI